MHLTVSLFSQENLVINPGMEETVPTPPTHHWNTKLKVNTPLAPDWFTATEATADYFNSHESTMMGSPTVVAHRGQGRIGFICGAKNKYTRIDYKEYPMGKLVRPLEANKNYCVTFHIALDGSSKFAMDSIGFYFSPEPVGLQQTTLIKVKPAYVMPADSIVTAKDGWVEVKAVYPANGGERYIVFGSFSHKDRIKLKSIGEHRPKRFHFSKVKKLAYYYLDDVSVSELPDSTDRPCLSGKTKNVAKSNRYLFLVDVSGSMHAGGNLDSVKQALKNSIRELPAEAEVAMVSFSGEPKLIVPFSSPQAAGLNASIDSLKHGGYTNVANSIEFAYNYLQKSEKAEGTSIMLFTDGIFEVNVPTNKRILQNYHDHQIRFSTFQFGDRTNFDLEKVAAATKADYIKVQSEQLNDMLAPHLYDVVEIPNKEKVYYTHMRFEMIAIRPLRYWLFILIGVALGVKYF